MAFRPRRNPILATCAALTIIYFLFFYPFAEVTDFRKTTEAGLARKHSIMQGDISDEALTEKTNRKLQDVLEKIKGGSVATDQVDNTEKPLNRPGSTLGADEEEVSVAGRKSMPKSGQKGLGKEKPKYPLGEDEEEAFNGNKVETAADPGEEMAREELQRILKKSPIIIFSKSYCGFSKRAKALLLETYTITPTPWVVELDLLKDEVPKPKPKSGQVDDDTDDESPSPTLGKKLQDLLALLTGRKTVPNIMINSQSLGGADDLAKLDAEGKLVDEIKRLGGNRIVSVERKKEKD